MLGSEESTSKLRRFGVSINSNGSERIGSSRSINRDRRCGQRTEECQPVEHIFSTEMPSESSAIYFGEIAKYWTSPNSGERINFEEMAKSIDQSVYQGTRVALK